MICRTNTPDSLPVELSEDRVWRLFKELPDGRFEPTGLVMLAPAGFLLPATTDSRAPEPPVERVRRTGAKTKAERAAMPPSPMERIGAILDEIERRDKAANSLPANLPEPNEPVRDADAEALAKLRAWKR